MRPVRITEVGIRYKEADIVQATRILDDEEIWRLDDMALAMKRMIDEMIRDMSLLDLLAAEDDDAMGDDPPPAVDDPEDSDMDGQNHEVDYTGPSRIRIPTSRTTLRLMKKAFKPDYGKARRDLIDQLGQYCCYCESPVSSFLAIEHRLPKSLFPEQAYVFSNFLLACDACNATKHARPDHADTQDGEGHPMLSDAASAALNNVDNIAWPQLYAATGNDGDEAIRPVTIELWNIRGNSGGSRSTAWQRELDEEEANAYVDAFINGTLFIDEGYIRLKPGATDVLGARVVSNYMLDEVTAVAVERLIDIVGLNSTDKVGKNYSIDRRIEMRTLAMLTALAAKRTLNRAHISRARREIPAIETAILQLIKATGFWSIWMHVLGPAWNHRINVAFPGTRNREWL